MSAKASSGVRTDALNLWIDRHGGDIVKVTLPTYPVNLEAPDVPFTLLDRTAAFTYVAQSGLAGPDGLMHDPKGGPASARNWTNSFWPMAIMFWRFRSFTSTHPACVTKRFSFERGAYHVASTTRSTAQRETDHRKLCADQAQRRRSAGSERQEWVHGPCGRRVHIAG